MGVAADVQQLLIRQGDASEEAVYIPVAQDPQNGLILLLRSSGDPLELTEPIRAVLGRIDPDITLNQVLTMEQFVDQFFVGINVMNAVLGGFGVLALLLAALGTYGDLAGRGVGTRIGPRLEKPDHDLVRTCFAGQMQGSVVTEPRQAAHVGPCVKQDPHHLHVPGLRRPMKGRHPVTLGSVDVGPVLEQRPHGLDVAVHGRVGHR